MNNLDIAYFVIISLFTVGTVVISFILSAKHNSKVYKEVVEQYVRKRPTSKEVEEEEHFIMNELVEGGIKCHKLPNSALPYNVEEWVDNMESFMEKPVFNQLLEMKGYDME